MVETRVESNAAVQKSRLVDLATLEKLGAEWTSEKPRQNFPRELVMELTGVRARETNHTTTSHGRTAE